MPSAKKPRIRAMEGNAKQEIQVGDTDIVSITDLLSDPASVINQVHESGNPAAVTRHGEFLAVILPLAGTGIEQYTFTQKEDLAYFAALLDESDQGPYYSEEEIESTLGVNATEKGVQ